MSFLASVIIPFLATPLFAFAPPSGHANVMLVGAAMTFDAVPEVTNPFLDVLAPDPIR
jgi:hypothetical protein